MAATKKGVATASAKKKADLRFRLAPGTTKSGARPVLDERSKLVGVFDGENLFLFDGPAQIFKARARGSVLTIARNVDDGEA